MIRRAVNEVEAVNSRAQNDSFQEADHEMAEEQDVEC
jgi:hypothetical protein